MRLCGGFNMDTENFFVFADKSEIPQNNVRSVLKNMIKGLNLNPDLYNCQSFRGGRATALQKYGVPVEIIKKFGRWKSNAVYRYFKSMI